MELFPYANADRFASREESFIQLCNSGIPCARLILPSLQTFHVFDAQLEIEDLRIFLDPGVSHALGQHHEALLQAPAKQDLSRCFVVFGHKRLE
jgi:hypothetical protein